MAFQEQNVFSQNGIFNNDLTVYGCLKVGGSCGIIFNAPDGSTKTLTASSTQLLVDGVGIGAGSNITANNITLQTEDGDNVYNITSTADGIIFQTLDEDNDGEPDNGYVNIRAGLVTATGYSTVGGGSTQYLMADGSVSTRYIGVGVGSTPGSNGGNAIGNDGDIWYTLC